MTPEEVRQLNARYAAEPAEKLCAWTLERYGQRVALASSFGAEDVALIDILSKSAPGLRVFTLDTGRLNEETYEVMDRVRRRYGLVIETYFPETARVEALEREKGYYSFRQSVEARKECCGIRKVEPLRRALSGLEAWMTGLRREQAVTRTALELIEIDASNGGILKINPLAGWTHDQLWAYIRANAVPYNRLHDAGYPSIGCSPCTRAVAPGEDVRAGRWWWENPEHKECGLHLSPKAPKKAGGA
ncbi:MAG: Thioredoxin-dependent 5'-adenylylsulfate reductase [Candidatus Omnitrophica bacterium]|nr:Thioredoxin-dependent 5'-adenylylsulfate reductase [Candidatus Omnitrophota bacterium]